MNVPQYIAAPNEIADVIGAEVLPEKCPDCKVWNLFMKLEQGLPFCWGCVTDRKTASEGRTALTKAKLATKGIVLEHRRIPLANTPEDDEEAGWPCAGGMPL